MSKTVNADEKSTSESIITKVSLNPKETAQLVGVSVRTLYRLISEGRFPKPRKVGRSTRWDRLEVLNWWDGRAAA